MGAGSSHTFFCLWFFSSSLFPFPPGSDGDIRRLMTMFHTRGWGEEDNRLVSRVDFKHAQLLARRRPGQRPRGCSGLCRALTAPAAGSCGHGRACAPLPNPPLPKTQRFSPSSTSGELPAPAGRDALAALGELPPPFCQTPCRDGGRRGLARVAPEAREVAGSTVAAPGAAAPSPAGSSGPRGPSLLSPGGGVRVRIRIRVRVPAGQGSP